MPSAHDKPWPEINKSLQVTDFWTRTLGLPIIDTSNTVHDTIRKRLMLITSAAALVLLVISEFCYVAASSNVAGFVASLHIVGYGSTSFGKLLTLWYNNDTFKKLLQELAQLWPTSGGDHAAIHFRRRRLASLRAAQLSYSLVNTLGLAFYIATPLYFYLVNTFRGESAQLGHIWHVVYPFDSTQLAANMCVFIFEIYSGTMSVAAMLGSDIHFITMASHVTMLLELLQLRICRLGSQEEHNTNGSTQVDCYPEIRKIIKIHQKLISFANALEDSFCVVNLINVVVSSVIICCVVFNILLDPLMEFSNKFFLGSVLTQVGIMCWYADAITTSNTDIAHAAYSSAWYNSNPRCRRALLLLIQRSQKPLHFTAYKFSPITMSTYSSILSNSYSYFTLLYTAYRKD